MHGDLRIFQLLLFVPVCLSRVSRDEMSSWEEPQQSQQMPSNANIQNVLEEFNVLIGSARSMFVRVTSVWDTQLVCTVSEDAALAAPSGSRQWRKRVVPPAAHYYSRIYWTDDVYIIHSAVCAGMRGLFHTYFIF